MDIGSGIDARRGEEGDNGRGGRRRRVYITTHASHLLLKQTTGAIGLWCDQSSGKTKGKARDGIRKQRQGHGLGRETGRSRRGRAGIGCSAAVLLRDDDDD